MMQAKRWKLSATQRAEMWNRWKAGQSLHAIGRALGKDHVVSRFLLARHGGIAPPPRRRSPRSLTLELIPPPTSVGGLFRGTLAFKGDPLCSFRDPRA